MDENQGSVGPGHHEWLSLEDAGQGAGRYCQRCGYRWAKAIDQTLCPGRAPPDQRRVQSEYDPYA
jgi:hypothetical protein